MLALLGVQPDYKHDYRWVVVAVVIESSLATFPESFPLFLFFGLVLVMNIFVLLQSGGFEFETEAYIRLVR